MRWAQNPKLCTLTPKPKTLNPVDPRSLRLRANVLVEGFGEEVLAGSGEVHDMEVCKMRDPQGSRPPNCRIPLEYGPQYSTPNFGPAPPPPPPPIGPFLRF